MNIRILPTALLGFITIIIINWSCTKLDTTNLGDDLLPVVDNVNTFSNTLYAEVFQGVFNDTTLVTFSADKILGKITNDPEFGSTDARIYAQFKPSFYPYYIQPSTDTFVALDSVVLALAVKGAWGDTASSITQTITVRAIPDHTGGLWDSLYKSKRLSYSPIPDNTGEILGSTVVDLRNLDDTIKYNNGKSKVVNQIRIKLSAAFVQKILDQDSAKVTRAGYVSNGFYKDSIFREYFEGFAIESSAQGQALMRISLTDDNSRLELHYRKRYKNVLDTTFTTFNFNDNTFATVPSAAANKIIRTHVAPFFPPPAGPQDEIYIQTTPGTYADLKFPELSIFRDTNRIIHRAQVRIMQIPGLNDDKFTAPSFLYLDLRDTTTGPTVNHKPIYIDLNPSFPYYPDNVPKGLYFPQEVNFGYFGGFKKMMADPNVPGKQIAYYDFNISRYIQQMVIKQSPAYEMRLFAPYSFSYPQYDPQMIDYGNNLAYGRVKVGGSTGNYRMQMTIIWSKVKVP